ncbi:hypothetical protein P8452_41619 [Trifolium repens]|nr:hypothetical protein P8452_41619 [Trifolium repens]
MLIWHSIKKDSFILESLNIDFNKGGINHNIGVVMVLFDIAVKGSLKKIHERNWIGGIISSGKLNFLQFTLFQFDSIELFYYKDQGMHFNILSTQ